MTAPIIKILFDARAIAARVQALGQRLQREVAHEDPVVVSLLGGSVIFLADLIRSISTPLRYEFVEVQYTAHEESGAEEVVDIHYPIPLEVTGQSVLVLKDVVSSAVTEPYLEQQLRDHGAAQVRFAALIDLPDERKTAFDLHYSALISHREGVLVGYGLKAQGRYGNLPYVGRLADEA